MENTKIQISDQICKNGDEYLTGLYQKIIENNYPPNYNTHKYGEHKEADKGRDIVVTDPNRFAIEIIQVKHSLNINSKLNLSTFLSECGKTLLNIILDEKENLQLVGTSFKYTIACNYKVQKEVHDYNYRLNRNIPECANQLFDSAKKLNYGRFKSVDFIDVKDDLEKILKILIIDYYDHDKLINKINESEFLRMSFDNIPINLSDYTTKDFKIEDKSSYRFIKELNAINYYPPDIYYMDALENFVLANGIINNIGSLKVSLLYVNHWWTGYTSEIIRNYRLRREDNLETMIVDKSDLIIQSRKFYKQLINDNSIIHYGNYIYGTNSIYCGVLHHLIENESIESGWILND